MKFFPILPALLIALSPALTSAADPPNPDPAKKEQPAKKADPKKDAKKDDQKKQDPKKGDGKKPEPKKPGEKKPPAKKNPARTDMIEEEAIAILKPYDKDANFEIDVDEMEAVIADFKKAPKGPLQQFDKGKDGDLDMLIDRTGMNVKLGAAAPKTKPAAKPAAPKKAEPKKP